MTIPTVALHGNYFDNNFGDLILFKVFERWILSAFQCRIVYPMVPAVEKARFQAHFPNAIVNSGAPIHWDVLVYSGGGLFADTGVGSRFLPGHFDKRFLKENVLPAELSIFRRKAYAILGLEVGPLSNIFVRLETKRIFRHAHTISIRDMESLNFVKNKFGIQSEIACAPDPAVTISKEDIPQEAFRPINAMLEPLDGKVLLGVHHPRDFLLGSAPSESMKEALLTSLRAYRNVIPVLFTDIGDNKYSMHCEKLSGIIKHYTGRESIRVPFPGVWETVALITKLSAVLTTKLHVGIVAYALGVYCESFANHSKTARFYKLIGRPDQCTLLKDVDKKIATEKITRAMEITHRVPALTDSAWQSIRNEADLHRKMGMSFLESTL